MPLPYANASTAALALVVEKVRQNALDFFRSMSTPIAIGEAILLPEGFGTNCNRLLSSTFARVLVGYTQRA
jgi:hypothetical protein